jgi:hypothetical protein
LAIFWQEHKIHNMMQNVKENMVTISQKASAATPSSGLIDAHPTLLLSAYVPKCSMENSAQYFKCLI